MGEIHADGSRRGPHRKVWVRRHPAQFYVGHEQRGQVNTTLDGVKCSPQPVIIIWAILIVEERLEGWIVS